MPSPQETGAPSFEEREEKWEGAIKGLHDKARKILEATMEEHASTTASGKNQRGARWSKTVADLKKIEGVLLGVAAIVDERNNARLSRRRTEGKSAHM